MSNQDLPPETVSDNEAIARFIVQSSQVTATGVHHKAFEPTKNLLVSVTRHINLDPAEVDRRGLAVAKKRELPLLGRADLKAADARTAAANMDVVAAQENGNSHHAHICGWHPEKEQQKLARLKLARASTFVRYAPPNNMAG